MSKDIIQNTPSQEAKVEVQTQDQENEFFFSFPSIEQFRHCVKESKRYLDKQENLSKDKQNSHVILFEGTVKLHGTNAGLVIKNGENEYKPQSRERLVTIDRDNNGFAAYSLNPKVKEFITPKLLKLFEEEKSKNPNLKDFLSIGLFGEWAGENIQKGVGICNLKKFFAPFGICLFNKIYNETSKTFDTIRHWLPTETLKQFYDEELRIFPIVSIPNCSFEIAIDFSKETEIALKANELSEITFKVEEQCPFAKHFGFEGIGEGIVWKNKQAIPYIDNNGNEKNIPIHQIVFKVKGEKHSSSKVKTPKQYSPFEVERMKKAEDFVEYALTESRLNQAFEYLKSNVVITEKDSDISSKQTGDFICWILKDIQKEEIDTITENGLEMKSLNSLLSKNARNWFLKKLDEIAFSQT